MRKRQKGILSIVAILYLATLPSTVHLAQINKSSLGGVVTDQSGAVVVGAEVTLVEESTQIEHKATTDSRGAYNFVGLGLGQYKMSISQPSFRTLVRSGIVLNAGNNERVDVTLEVGEITQQVEVTGEAPLIDERTAVYGTVEDTPTLRKLPLQLGGGKRDPTTFIQTVPGFQNGSGFQNTINGSVGTYSELMVDGAPGDVNPAVHGSFRGGFSTEALAEFKVVSSASAEYGLTGGVVISFVTQSGSNELHGAAYEYLRNEALDARSFFAQNVAIGKRNEFGFKLGGPVVIPRVYNGHNKTFFFANVGRFIFHSAVAGTVLTLPTGDFKSGNLSALLGPQVGTDALGRPVRVGQIYDPSTTRSDGQGGFIRDPFQGNIIPSSRFSPVSAAYQSNFPALTFPELLANNYVGAGGPGISNETYYTFKIDHVKGNDKFSGVYWRSKTSATGSFPLPKFFGPIGGQPGGNGELSHGAGNNVRLNWTHTFSSKVLLDVIFGVDQNRGGFEENEVTAQGGTAIGLKGTLIPCAPQVNISGGFPFLGLQTCHQVESDTNWRWMNNLSVQKGKHSLKFGGNRLSWNANFPTSVLANGRFNFRPVETGLPGAFFSQTGAGYASFLLGEVDSSEVTGPTTGSPRQLAVGFYAQDEYRVTPKLTLNLGLRYDIQPMFRDENDKLSNFDSTVPNPAAGGILGALTFVGEGPGRIGRRRIAGTNYNNFGPRFGFAYKLLDKTVLRGGYGLYFGPVNQLAAGGAIVNRQGLLPQFGRQSIDGGVTSAFNWTNGFPLPANLEPTLDPTVANGSSTDFFGPESSRAPRIQQLNLGVQHELPNNMLIDVSYIGNFSHMIGSGRAKPANQLDYSRFGGLGSLLTANIDSAQAQAAGIRSPYPGFQGTVAQALRPFPQYQIIQDLGATVNNIVFNGVQFKLQKQTSKGVSFLIGYTISKTLGDTDSTPGFFASHPQDAYNRRAEKAPTDVDMPQNLILSYTYDLPLGPGKRFANSPSIFNRHVLGGWSISGIHTYQSGRALAITTNQILPTLAAAIRPNLASNVAVRTSVSCESFDPATDNYLNRSAFANPAPFSFGNAPRRLGDVRSCGSANENISVAKTNPLIRERLLMRFGADFFNVFNRHVWGAPATNIDDPNFGRIASTGPGRTIQLHLRFDW